MQQIETREIGIIYPQDITRITKEILKQNAAILAMNDKLLQHFAVPMCMYKVGNVSMMIPYKEKVPNES